MPDTLNVAVVGCGYWGPNLIRNLAALPQCRLKRVCDLDPERLAHVQRLYPGLEASTHLSDLLEDPQIDAIAIATPVRTHFHLARSSLEAGKHTFIEKPMASTSAQSRELIDLAEKQKLTLMVGHVFLYCSAVRKIKEIVDSGDIGDILYISSRRLNLGLFQKDINVAWDLAPHDISIILHVMEQSPVSVNCQGRAHVSPGIEDMTNMSLSFANGGLATIQSSWLDPNKVREMTIVGSRKMILYDDTEPLEKIKIYDKRVESPPHYNTFAEFHYSYHYGDMYAPYLKQAEPLRVECQDFLEAIRTGSKPVSDGWEGFRVVQILEASSESLRNGGASVQIPG